MNQAINITAGLLNVLRDENGNIKYLGSIKPNNQESKQNEALPVPGEIAIPHTWWVQIYDHGRKHGVVVLMINEPSHDKVKLLDGSKCHQDTCIEANLSIALLRVLKANPDAVIYCCYPRAINEKYRFNGQNNVLTFLSEDEVVEQVDEVEAVTSEEEGREEEEQKQNKEECDDDEDG